MSTTHKFAIRTMDKLQAGLKDEDWTIAPISSRKPLKGFPKVPLVNAGDGGMWVPVFVYLKKIK